MLNVPTSKISIPPSDDKPKPKSTAHTPDILKIFGISIRRFGALSSTIHVDEKLYSNECVFLCFMGCSQGI